MYASRETSMLYTHTSTVSRWRRAPLPLVLVARMVGGKRGEGDAMTLPTTDGDERYAGGGSGVAGKRRSRACSKRGALSRCSWSCWATHARTAAPCVEVGSLYAASTARNLGSSGKFVSPSESRPVAPAGVVGALRHDRARP